MSSYQLTLIDDDIRLGTVLTEYLEKYGHSLTHFSKPNEGLDNLKSSNPDLVILDIMMPIMDGLEVCREIRKFSDVPILFLSARGDTTDRIIGLEIGADDYLPKPFEPRELLARIDSIIRRCNRSNFEAQSASGLKLDVKTMEASLDGENLELTSMEFQALYFLYTNRQKIISRDDLLNHLQGMEVEVYGRAIDILISRLRQKLKEDPKAPNFIRTIRGQGYRFIGEV